MKVLGKTNNTVIVEMTSQEYVQLSKPDISYRSEGNTAFGDIQIGSEVGVLKLSQHLLNIRKQTPDLKQIRGVFQAFLALTEPEEIASVLDAAGIPEPFGE